MILSNPATKDEFEYDIKGIGEEPLAEKHIVIDCKPKKTKQHVIEISNEKGERTIRYKVETDSVVLSGD